MIPTKNTFTCSKYSKDKFLKQGFHNILRWHLNQAFIGIKNLPRHQCYQSQKHVENDMQEENR